MVQSAVAVVLFFGFAPLQFSYAAHPSVLIYKGPGSCDEGCSEAVAEIAKKAGYSYDFVAPDALKEDASEQQERELFKHAKVWVQPGGIANQAFDSMTSRLRAALKKFIREGGGYVGFCAGAFMATHWIGGTGELGLDIFPGGTNLYSTTTENPRVIFSLEKLNWLGKIRTVYFEGGPYLYGIENDPAVEKIAYYDTGYIAAARTSYGKGRVFITGAHPEAPRVWSEEDGIYNPEGDTHDLAAGMIQWAAGEKRSFFWPFFHHYKE